MELVFHEETIRYLCEKRFDQLYQEQTAEMTLPENRPEVRRIVDCYGLVLVQNKNVESGMVTVSGGIQAGVLYVSEEERLERIDVVLPFTVSKKVTTEDGAQLFYWGWLKSIDARLINSRKVLVRANLGSELTVLENTECRLSRLTEKPEDLCCRTAEYTMRLPLCAAERDIQIADEIPIPEQQPGIARLLKWSCVVLVSDTRLIGNKAVFKGSISLRCLYEAEDDTIHLWTGEVPYSQYAELDREMEDGTVVIQPILRQAELDSDGQIDSHRLLLNITATAQILVRGDVAITLTEDAYSLSGVFSPDWSSCELPACLDTAQIEQIETVSLPQDADQILDWTVMADAASISASKADRVTIPLNLNLLYSDSDHQLSSKAFHLESAVDVPGSEESRLRASVCIGTETELRGQQLKLPLKVELLYEQVRPMRNLCGGSISESGAGETQGPSLLAARCRGTLWEIAKKHRTTVEALQIVNGLDTDRLDTASLLLVPLGQAAKAAVEVKK